MKLTPTFSIYPHGVRRCNTGNNTTGLFAVFKIICSAAELDDVTSSTDSISADEWNTFVQSVNGYFFSYDFASGTLTITVSRIKSTVNQVYFSANSDTDRSGSIQIPGRSGFQFGMRDPYGEKGGSYQVAFFADTSKKFTTAKKDPSPQVIQHWRDVTTKDVIAHQARRQQMDMHLKNRKKEERKPDDNNFDFRHIYATIMNEPLIAEQHYGFVREMLLPLDLLGDTSTENIIDYKIVVNLDGTANDMNTTSRLWVKKTTHGIKYYNGNARIFFSDEDFVKNQVQVSYQDLYKEALQTGQKASPHPDGLYINIVYPDGAASAPDGTPQISDPFQEKGIKGYNIVVNDDLWHSLSYHERSYTFKNADGLSYKTSGMLNPQSGVVLNEGHLVRSNLLMAWRGDNLLINRETLKRGNTDNRAMGETTTMKFDKQAKEDRYIRDQLFTKSEKLLNSTQCRLNVQGNYYVLIRAVGYGEHYLPLVSELAEGESDYVLTIEDSFADPKVSGKVITKQRISFPVGDIQDMPIKAVNIKGYRAFDDRNSGNVDHGSHMVVNELGDSQSDERFVYPPAIKLEDFRYLGYMSKNLLKKHVGEYLELGSFVHRCHHLEHLSGFGVPPVAFSRQRINYLADPRGRQLMVYPANLYTLSKLQPFIENGHFDYSDNYPYYNGIRSSKISAALQKRSDLPGMNLYEVKLNDKVIFDRLQLGLLKFKLFIKEKGNTSLTDLQYYHGEPLQLSLIGKPAKPSSQSRKDVIRDIAYPNYWSKNIQLSESDTWKSVKYTEKTFVLDLQQKNMEQVLAQKAKADTSPVALMIGEYPYSYFLTLQDKDTGLRTSLYPDQINLDMNMTDATSGIGDIFLSLKLNDKETLNVQIVVGGLKLCLNDEPLFPAKAAASSISLVLSFSPSLNQYQFIWDKNTSAITTSNLINPDMGIADINVSQEVFTQLVASPARYFIKLNKSGNYSFIGNLQHPYSVDKKVTLFASSPFQGYLPGYTMEHELGTSGEQFDIFIPNNQIPAPPVMEANVLLMYTKDDHWHDNFAKQHKASKTQSLIQLTLSVDFMTEGRNSLALILSCDDTSETRVCATGEDITKLSSYATTTLSGLIGIENEGLEVFNKYGNGKPQNLRVGSRNYSVLIFTPFYNVKLAQWQVIFPLKMFTGIETLFLKLCAMKIAPGYSDQTCYSDLTDSVILPVYNSRTIAVDRNHGNYTISYNGPDGNKRKLFFVMLVRKELNSSLFQTDSFNDLATFSCGDNRGKILQFYGAPVTIQRIAAKKILIMEFEALDNYSGDLNGQPVFITKNPVFDLPGIRLINIAELETGECFIEELIGEL